MFPVVNCNYILGPCAPFVFFFFHIYSLCRLWCILGIRSQFAFSKKHWIITILFFSSLSKITALIMGRKKDNSVNHRFIAKIIKTWVSERLINGQALHVFFFFILIIRIYASVEPKIRWPWWHLSGQIAIIVTRFPHVLSSMLLATENTLD